MEPVYTPVDHCLSSAFPFATVVYALGHGEYAMSEYGLKLGLIGEFPSDLMQDGWEKLVIRSGDRRISILTHDGPVYAFKLTDISHMLIDWLIISVLSKGQDAMSGEQLAYHKLIMGLLCYRGLAESLYQSSDDGARFV